MTERTDMKNSLWETVTKENPCPICGKGDWCIRATSGEVAICYRNPSPYLAKSGSGWIHRLKDCGGTSADSTLTSAYSRVEVKSNQSNSTCREATCGNFIDFARLHASFFNDEHLIDGFACELGVEGAALRALDVRYNPFDKCWSFPMRDADGKIVGLRYREFGGSRKWSARGSHDGLFFSPALLRSSLNTHTSSLRTLYIVEGASDTAAALSLGLMAVGRSSCSSGAALLKELLARLRPSSLAIIADNDAPGLAGARALSQELGSARILTPPEGCKDLRGHVVCEKITNNIDLRLRSVL